jgi:hypothetical protein
MPIKSDAKASLGVTGTFEILIPPFEKNPDYLFCKT